MPYNLTVREAYPPVFESIEIVGVYKSGGSDPIDYYNATTKTIIPGEPIWFANRLCISKSAIAPGEFGSLVWGAVVDWLVNPALAANILQGATVWFSVDLANAGLYIPGYATNAAPTNGYVLGTAIAPYAAPAEVWKTGGNAIAAGPASAGVPASKYVRTLMTLANTAVVLGTVQTW